MKTVNKKIIVKLYEEGKGLREIARLLSTNKETIRWKMMELGISRRSVGRPRIRGIVKDAPQADTTRNCV